MTFYDAWKMVFSYVSQPTVIDVACEIKVDTENKEPLSCVADLTGCEAETVCGDIHDVK